MEKVSIQQINNVMYPRFLSYAQSVLLDRAIPSGYDGLKPIHRRILLAMHELKLNSNMPYRKSAKTIGLVLSDYHPHGDQSAYEAMVGLSQNFNMRYPLIDGSGNFGSVNGESAAAMRYTEARLSPYGELLLGDVDRLSETKDNFDNSRKEAINLPGFFLNLLCNANMGISVGFAAKFAPHYAKDVYSAIIRVLDNKLKDKDTDIEELIRIIKAPDFPSGATIVNGSEMANIYKTGKGSVVLRAKYVLEKDKIVYTEIPYKVTPCSITTAIASLNISDIKDIRDETSSRTGIRIVVELKKGANSEWIINKLFKETPLQSNYNINMIAILDNKPVIDLDLKTIIYSYIQNMVKVHHKDLQLQLDDINMKLKNTLTMLKVIQNINSIVRIIKEEDNPKAILKSKLGFDDEEATYILNCRLNSLSKASKEDLEAKKDRFTEEQKRLSDILNNRSKFLTDLRDKFIITRDSKIFKNDKRLTNVVDLNLNSKTDIRDYIKKEPVVVTYSNKGMIKAIRPNEFKTTGRNSMGVKSKSLREDEYICNMLTLDTHSELLLFSDLGKCYTLPVCKIPISTRNGSSKSINNYLNLEDEEHILSVIGINNNDSSDNKSIVMTTKLGYIKRMELSLLTKTRSSLTGIKSITLQENDKIKGINICSPNTDVIIFTSAGRGLKINIDDEVKPLRCNGRAARGCSALKLKNDEIVVNASVINENQSIILVTTEGFGKRLEHKAFKNQKRNQSPINYMSKIEKVGKIVDGIMINADEDLLITTKLGQTVRLKVDNITSSSRTAQGLKLINIKQQDDVVVGISAIKREEELINEQ